MFASWKLPFRDLLLAVAHYVNAAKGLSAIRLSQELEVSYKAAWVLSQKFAEALTAHQHSRRLRGVVEMDGAYFGGYVRPKNTRPIRVDRRRLPHRSGKRQCVVIMREREGRSRAFVCSEREGAILLSTAVEPGSVINTDRATTFDRIAAHFELRTVNHTERYADGDVSTNWAESYFSRLRKAEVGTHSHIAGPYLLSYANAISWREDRRRHSNQENYTEALRITTHHPVSRLMKGYWQRRKAA